MSKDSAGFPDDAFDFDLFVIGGGSGGVRAGRIAAAEHGARVAMAEESRMGGTCVIRGCVPKKLMIFAASAPEAAAEAQGYGWRGATAGRFDWPTFRAALHTELSRLEAIYENGFTVAGGTLFKQRATVQDAHTVRLADGQTVSAKHILVATGGRPVRPDIPGAELGLISDDLFELETLPARALVIGGGFIGCEFATILNGLGSKTTLAHRGDHLLRGFDEDMREHVDAQMVEIGIDLRLETKVTAISAEGDARRVRFGDGSEAVFDAVFFALGRAPYTGGLGLAEVGVHLGSKGQVMVDRWSQTSVPSIFAVGDVTDRVNLTPVAIREGHAFADTIFGARARSVDHELVASAVYTRPFEVGTVGLTEDEAAARGPVEVFVADFAPMRQKFAGRPGRVSMKLIVDASDGAAEGKVLGCHIFAPEAGEMIQMAAIAMGMGATKADFDRTMAVHPTLAEEIVTMRRPVRRHGPVELDQAVPDDEAPDVTSDIAPDAPAARAVGV
ncbi:glutathione-disulfide reductase [Paracoccus suum]|uniref:Glutathione-disulfide reductase n=1 Tax=Paracoccus suum TaxID=2259340 RepID=A0A344PKG1_9RHOB|nr:glutathione-disulfide reductase [Paracoccus suum]AXC49866.1 glutathione-disulfide reductase [Paracoccus suum]